MHQARNSSLMLNFKRGTATAMAALVTVVAPFNASAHVLPGSVLEKHKGFINAMTHKTKYGYEQSCCHEKDGQGGLEEKKTIAADGTVQYKVKLVNDEWGKPLEKPVWIDIPPEAVLIYKDAVAFCKNLREREPLNPDAETCTMPTTNALWTNEIPHTVAAGQPLPFTIYCYLPKPPKF